MNPGSSPSPSTGRGTTTVRRIAAVFAAGVTAPPAPRPRWLRRGRVDLVAAADVIVALISFAATNSRLVNLHPPYASAAVILAVSLALNAPLAVRTWFPLTAWVASALAMLWVGGGFGGVSTPGGALVYILCLYAVAVRCEAWVVITAGVVTVVGGIIPEGQPSSTAILAAAVPVLAGVIVRTRRGNAQLLAVQERRHEGERAVLEERQRIARELHDVVAHHMSVIAIQAEAAPYKVPEPPKELVESFAEIRASALSGLKELRRVLGVLRSDAPGTAPQPSLDDLDGLLESARSAGVTVTAGVSGIPRPLPAGVDLSAYRIVQEALSNAMRHAPGAAVQVKLYYGDAALVVEVRNDRCPPGTPAAAEWDEGPGEGGGHGIIGMRERATMLGGNLQAGPTEKGEFLVTAALPMEPGSAQDES